MATQRQCRSCHSVIGKTASFCPSCGENNPTGGAKALAFIGIGFMIVVLVIITVAAN